MGIGRPLIRVHHGMTRREIRVEYAAFWNSMMSHVGEAVVKSFITEGMEHPTRAAVKERVDICKKLVDELRQDFIWSRQRIRDHLTYILRARLNGEQIDLEHLSRRATW